MRNIKIESVCHPFPASCCDGGDEGESQSTRAERHSLTWNRPRSRISLFLCVPLARGAIKTTQMGCWWGAGVAGACTSTWTCTSRSRTATSRTWSTRRSAAATAAPSRPAGGFRSTALWPSAISQTKTPATPSSSVARTLSSMTVSAHFILFRLAGWPRAFFANYFARRGTTFAAWGCPFFTPTSAAPASIMDFWAAGSVALGQNTGTSQIY